MLPTTKSKPNFNPMAMTTLVYGQPKIGKSTFCSQFPDALFIATETGLNHLETYNVMIKTYDDLIQVYKELEAGNHNFKTIIFDTVDRLYEIVRMKVLQEMNITDESEAGYGKGWGAVKKNFDGLVYKFVRLGLGVVFVSHAEIKIEKNRVGEEVPKAYPTLPKRAKETICNLVDIILYLENALINDENGNPQEARVIRTKGTISYEAGDRTGKLPDTLPLNYADYIKCFEVKK